MKYDNAGRKKHVGYCSCSHCRYKPAKVTPLTSTPKQRYLKLHNGDSMRAEEKAKEYAAGYKAGVKDNNAIREKGWVGCPCSKESEVHSDCRSRYRPDYNTESGVIGISFNNDKRYLKLDDGNIIDTETNTILIRAAIQEILDY